MDSTTKGLVTKEFFPNIKDRLKMKIKLSPNFTVMITAHGTTRSYLHCFQILKSPECPCTNCNQTVDHLLFDCSKLNNEREKLIAREGNLPLRKSELVNKYLEHVISYISHTVLTMKSCRRSICAKPVFIPSSTEVQPRN